MIVTSDSVDCTACTMHAKRMQLITTTISVTDIVIIAQMGRHSDHVFSSVSVLTNDWCIFVVGATIVGSRHTLTHTVSHTTACHATTATHAASIGTRSGLASSPTWMPGLFGYRTTWTSPSSSRHSRTPSRTQTDSAKVLQHTRLSCTDVRHGDFVVHVHSFMYMKENSL